MMNISKKLCAGVAAAVLATAVVAGPAQAAERTATCNLPAQVERVYVGADLVAVGLEGKVADTFFSDSENSLQKLNYLMAETFNGAQQLDAKFNRPNLNIDQATVSVDEFNCNANANLHASLKAMKGATFAHCVNTEEGNVIYAEQGDIHFNDANSNVQGLVYAPNGTVYFNGAFSNLNNITIIAKGVVVNDDEYTAQVNFSASHSVNETLGQYLNIR